MMQSHSVRVQKLASLWLFKKVIIFYIFFEKGIDFSKKMWYNIKAVMKWPVGQAAKTLASHAGNMGSIPVRVTKKDNIRTF